jgi:hypothetical protein
MENENNKADPLDWDHNPAAEQAFYDEYRPKRKALLDKVRAGEMTEDECAEAIIQLRRDLGHKSTKSHEREKAGVLNVMMHSLHQDELDRMHREEGIIID